MTTSDKTPTFSEQVQVAKDNLTAARILKKNATTPEETKTADALIVETLRDYRKLVPSQREPAAKLRPDPQITPETVRAENIEAREEQKTVTVGDYLEPEMQRLLAQGALRDMAVRNLRRWITWLSEAEAYCAQREPALAAKLISEVITALRIEERAVIDAPTKPGKAKKKGG